MGNFGSPGSPWSIAKISNEQYGYDNKCFKLKRNEAAYGSQRGLLGVIFESI
jgi:hypothetical protein